MQTTIDNTSVNLTDDIGSDLSGWTTSEYAYEGATVSNQRWQIVFNATLGRAGIEFLGSGSSGDTRWTDATSADDAYQRLIDDDLSN